MVDRTAGAANFGLGYTQDECPLSWSKKSRQSSRERLKSQVRNNPDPLLAAWEKTVARHGGEPAIFDTLGSALFRFQEIESLSREYEIGDSGLASLKAGEILAIQVGNHPHWPALFPRLSAARRSRFAGGKDR